MQKKPKRTAVIDTNILIGAFISPTGIGTQILSAWKQSYFSLLISPALIAEADAVLHRPKIFQRYHLSEPLIKELITDLHIASIPVSPMPVYDLPVHSRDIKDDIVLACAISGHAEYLVTLDEDLLALKNDFLLGTLHIITPMEFLEIIQEA